MTSALHTGTSVCSQVEDEVTTNVAGKFICKISDGNRGRKRRETEGQSDHATVVASKKRITNINGEATDSDRSDDASLEGKCNHHINVLARLCIYGAWHD